jgi:hypothetical protein
VNSIEKAHAIEADIVSLTAYQVDRNVAEVEDTRQKLLDAMTELGVCRRDPENDDAGIAIVDLFVAEVFARIQRCDRTIAWARRGGTPPHP